MDKSLRFWKKEFLDEVSRAKTFADMFLVAEKLLESMPKPVAQVCGPISSGGLGSIEKNLERFNEVIRKLDQEGHILFNQMPFEDPMQEIRANLGGPGDEETNLLLLESFYKPVFESGHIKKVFFIPGWESSYGSRWERKKAEEKDIEIIDLANDF